MAYVFGCSVALEVRLNGLVLLVELGQVGYEVLDDVCVGKRVNARLLLLLSGDAAYSYRLVCANTAIYPLFPLTQTRQRVDTINVHCATAANALSAASPECKSRVHLVLDPDERVQHHGSGLVQVEGVGLHLGLGRRLIGVPAVDMEGLGQGILVQRRLLDGCGLRLGNWWARGGHGLGGGGNGLALGVFNCGGHATGEHLLRRGAWRKAPGSKTESHFAVVWVEWRVCGGLIVEEGGSEA
jgi:hypothetical protein